jgi:hypothetical protein
MGAGKIAAVAEIDLEGPEGIEGAEIRIDLLENILESSDHVHISRKRAARGDRPAAMVWCHKVTDITVPQSSGYVQSERVVAAHVLRLKLED